MARDDDDSDNGDVTYTIETTKWEDTFRIHPKTGVISAKSGLDPKDDYEFTVTLVTFLIFLTISFRVVLLVVRSDIPPY